MHRDEVWTAIHGERRSLASDLTGAGDAAWATPTQCDSWTVRDVLAHMVATAKMTPSSFFAKLAASGFRFSRLQSKDVETEGAGGGPATLARFVQVQSSVSHPPGPTTSWLGETIVHAEDIRGALGLTHEYPIPAVVQVADFYKGSNVLIGTKRRIAGLALRATDASWTHGQGAEVAGPILPLLLAMTGRKSGLDHLSGDGVATLRARP